MRPLQCAATANLGARIGAVELGIGEQAKGKRASFRIVAIINSF
jgi:hypothetical protein